jgi:predicted DCC family thiol-disulfide oxidoreductase YuxK
VVRLDPEMPIVVFDGYCNLCTGAVLFLLRRDRRKRLRFAPLDSAIGRQAIAEAGDRAPGDTMLFAYRGVVSQRSTAALAIARLLPFPWPLASVFWIVPAPLRDLIYRLIANNRYRWFGKREECWVPTPELRARFLDGPDSAAPAAAGVASGG